MLETYIENRIQVQVLIQSEAFIIDQYLFYS